MRPLVVLLVSLLLCSCARWQQKSYAANHHVPKFVYLYVAVSNQVAQADDNGAVLTMVETIEADLRKDGIRTELVAARDGEPAPLPRIELQVVSSVGADRQMLGAGKLTGLTLAPLPSAARLAIAAPVAIASVEALGSLVVDCYVLPRNDGVATFAGRVAHDWADEGSPEATGHTIADTILN